ncbi:MAG: thioredoxin TrxA [Gammaproteobacteria bacterium]|nr:thioredoxin TrxA [Gammaproteobacteria bacterium]
MSKLLQVTDNSFEKDVLKSSKPILVDFWAERCNPCKMIAPVLEELSASYDGKLTIAKLNVDENHDTTVRYGILSIPTLLLFKEGEVVATKIGAASKSQLMAFIDSHL